MEKFPAWSPRASHYELDATKIMMVIITQSLSQESQHPRDQGRRNLWGLKGNNALFLLHPTPLWVSQDSDLSQFGKLPLVFGISC